MTPSVLFNFSSETWNFFKQNLSNPIEASICDPLMVESILLVEPIPITYMEKYKIAPIQDFHRFRYKNLLKIDFLK